MKQKLDLSTSCAQVPHALYLGLAYTVFHEFTFYSDVVRIERPDLEQQRNELIVNINKAKNELKVSYLTCSDTV